jgi:3-oxoacyl-[acyl-carrier-protein] synthase II
LPAHKVVITGIGLATPLGSGWLTFGRAIQAGGAHFEALDSAYIDPVPAARVLEDPLVGLSRLEAKLSDRHAQLALHAAERALQQAGLADQPAVRRSAGVYVGCGSGPTESIQRAYHDQMVDGGMHGLSLLRCLPSGAAALLALRHGLHGPALTQAAACASSTLALGEALRAIRHGYLDLALAGGAEAPFGACTLKAWDGLRVLAPVGDDPGRACRPFDRERRGLVLGEGAVFFVLESQAHARSRGAPVWAVLEGFGASCDAHHWTEPCAAGQAEAMRAALHDAQIEPGDVHGINAHGTGTVAGDQAEAESIAQVFGTRERAPWVHSTKSLHGHLLGASGAIELAAAIACMSRGRMPGTRNLAQTDAPGLRLVPATGAALPQAALMLSNSFAFGGGNACLVVSATRDRSMPDGPPGGPPATGP